MSLRKSSKFFRTMAIAVAIFVIITATLMTVSASINTTYSLDFEGGGTITPGSTYNNWKAEVVRNDSITVVSSPVRFGSKALKVNLLKTDPLVPNTGAGGKRAELSCNLRENSPEEHWYSVSIYLPTDYATDSSAEIIAQWHTVIHQGSPPIGFETDDGNWKVNINNDFNQGTWGDTYSLGSYSGDKGKWTDWVFHVKWGWNTSQSPILHIYKRTPSVSLSWGSPVLTYTQPNMYSAYGDGTPDDIYMKIGLYKWDWAYGNPSSTTTRTLYYDNVKYGNADSSLTELYPDTPVGPTPTPPPSGGHTIVGATATAEDTATGSTKEKSYDNNYSTRWSADCTTASQSITWDLGSSKAINLVKMAWHYGDTRTYDFAIDTSPDKQTWTRVCNRRWSAGGTLGLETYDVTNTNARYVRVIGYGNSVNKWFNIVEAQITP